MDIRLGYLPLDPVASAQTRAALVAWLRDWAETRLTSRLYDARRCFAPNVVLDLGNRGIFGMTVERSHGGLALRAVDWLRVFEQLAAIDLSLSQLVGVSTLAIRPIARFGSIRLKEELLGDLASGRTLAAYAQTEPGAGSDYTKMAATATRQPDGAWLLRGDKVFIGNAGWAGVTTVFAHTVEAGERGELGAFVVRAGTPGLRIGHELLTMGLRGVVQNKVALDGVRVPDADRLGVEGGSVDIGVDAMTITRLQLAASAIGGIKRCIQLVERFASRREVATGLLLDNPVVAATLGEMLAVATILDELVYGVAACLDRSEPVSMDVLAALKVSSSEALFRAADQTVQCLGSRGYDESSGVPQLLRDARVMRIFEGPTEPLTLFLGARAQRTDRGIHAHLRDALGATAVAARLRQAVEVAWARPSFADPQRALHWRRWVCGELLLDALLLGAATRNASLRPSPVATFALAWAEARFAASEARAGQTGAAERALPPTDVLRGAVRELATTIGDHDQRASGECHDLDPLLARDFEGAPAPQPRPSPAPEPQPEPEAQAEPARKRWLW